MPPFIKEVWQSKRIAEGLCVDCGGSPYFNSRPEE